MLKHTFIFIAIKIENTNAIIKQTDHKQLLPACAPTVIGISKQLCAFGCTKKIPKNKDMDNYTFKRKLKYYFIYKKADYLCITAKPRV